MLVAGLVSTSYPPAHIPLVSLPKEFIYDAFRVKSPKSDELPAFAIVTNSIVFK